MEKKKKSRLFKVGLVILVLGILCIFLKAVLPETIDENGMLHEVFFLLPMGFAAMTGGILLMIVSAICKVLRK